MNLPMLLDDSAGPAPKVEIPDKLYFRISEVSRLAGVPTYVLRFWETEFPRLAPRKSGSGHRLYRRKDVEFVLEIKRLVYEERFTLEGARRHLAARRKERSSRPAQASLFPAASPGLADKVRAELDEILKLLEGDGKG